MTFSTANIPSRSGSLSCLAGRLAWRARWAGAARLRCGCRWRINENTQCTLVASSEAIAQSTGEAIRLSRSLRNTFLSLSLHPIQDPPDILSNRSRPRKAFLDISESISEMLWRDRFVQKVHAAYSEDRRGSTRQPLFPFPTQLEGYFSRCA